MGMFDYLQIEDQIELKVPKELNLGVDDFEFQTKSLDRSMFLYTIANDKCLYRQDSFKKNSPRTKIEFHGIIDFGAYYSGDLVDHSVDYKAKFNDGQLQEIINTGHKTYFHESRKQKIKSIIEQQKKENNKFYKKVIRLIQNILVIYPFKILGFNFKSYGDVFKDENYTLSFCFPRITLFYNNERKAKIYGFSFDQITTEICFKNTFFYKLFSFKIFGIGFVFSYIKNITF